jgi:putative nucleotide binding protein
MVSRAERRGRYIREFRPHEDYAYVLDFMPAGNPLDKHPWHRTRPVAQLIGENFFLLFDASIKFEYNLEVGQRVALREVVAEVYDKVKRRRHLDLHRIEYDDLTSVAKSNLPSVVEKIVRSREQIFVEFFNIAGPITIRFHSLELLPGVGKKTVSRILEQREREPFKSFEDIARRTGIDPVKVIVERIIAELQGGQKYYLFVEPPRREMNEPVKPVFLNYLAIIYKRIESGEGGSLGGG